MVEPRTKLDSSLASFDHGRASVIHPIRVHSLPQPYLLQPPTSHHVGAFYHLSPKAAVDPSHYPQVTIIISCPIICTVRYSSVLFILHYSFLL